MGPPTSRWHRQKDKSAKSYNSRLNWLPEREQAGHGKMWIAQGQSYGRV